MSTYVFDQAWEKERQRLADLERWLDPGTTRHMTEIGVEPAWRCLEVGGGGGSIAQWLCSRTKEVVATDLDTRFLRALSEQNVTVDEHDITTGPYEQDGFDFAHARLLLEHLPAREEALANIIASVRPGGWVLIEDMDMITHIPVTPSDVYERVNQALITVMSAAGYDPFFGRRLPMLLTDAGLEDVVAEGRIVMDGREDSAGFAMFKLTLTHLRDAIGATGIATAEEVDRVIELVDDPTFASMPPTTIAAWGRKPLRA